MVPLSVRTSTGRVSGVGGIMPITSETQFVIEKSMTNLTASSATIGMAGDDGRG